MERTQKKLLTTLESVVTSLQGLVAMLKKQEVTIPPEVAEKIRDYAERGLCLVCNEPLEPGDRRGSHHSCYNLIRGQINSGEITEQDAVNDGKWNPNPKKPGRKAKHKASKAKAKAILDKAVKAQKDGTKGGTKKA